MSRHDKFNAYFERFKISVAMDHNVGSICTVDRQTVLYLRQHFLFFKSYAMSCINLPNLKRLFLLISLVFVCLAQLDTAERGDAWKKGSTALLPGLRKFPEFSGIFVIFPENTNLHDFFLCYENKFLLRNRAQKCLTN